MLSYFLQIMILKNTKALQFLKTLLPENTSLTIYRNVFFFPSKKIGFFTGFPKKALLKSIAEDTLWITSNSLFFRFNIKTLQPLYLLKKEKGAYALYDRRYLKLQKGLYLLPFVAVNSRRFLKPPFLRQKDNALLFPERTSSFYLEGDTTSRLENPRYCESLKKRRLKQSERKKILTKVFLKLKQKLDA